MKKYPYLLIVGEKEAQAGEVSVRKYGEDATKSMKIANFAAQIAEEVAAMIPEIEE